MSLNFLDTVRASTLALAVGAMVSGCGGGGGGGDEPTSTVSSNTTAGTTSSTSTSSTTTAVSTDVTPPAEDVASTVTPPVTVADSNPAPTDAATAPAATVEAVQVAVAASTGSTQGTSGTVKLAAGGTRSSVALNLGAISYYSPEVPTIDAMKRAGGWLTQCSTTCGTLTNGASSWDTKEQAALDVDANGWIRSLPASSDTAHKFRTVSTMLSASGTLPAGRYIVRYEGTGTITYSGFKKDSSSTAGRDVIDLTTTGNAWMTISATTPGNYLRNIRVYLPGGACANDYTTYAATAAACNSTTGAYVPFESFPANQIWHPSFLQDVKGFRALRFMDWNITNTTKAAVWADRTPQAARVWTGATGAPYEAEMDLANLVGADAWINIPPFVDDDYAARMGALGATHLSGALKLDLEYANEPWN